MPTYDILISGNAPSLYPTDTLFGVLYYSEDSALEIPKCYPFRGEWGEILSTHLNGRETYPLPIRLHLVYLSVIEKKFYEIDADLPTDEMEKKWGLTSIEEGERLFTHIVVGMAPFGQTAVWFRGLHKSILIEWLQGSRTEVDMSDFMPMNQEATIEAICEHYIQTFPMVRDHLRQNGLPPLHLFDKYMQQFAYRYVVRFGKWDEEKNEWTAYSDDEVQPSFDHIEESLFDGTHDKLHDGGLMKYHSAGKPKRLTVRWHIKKSDYSAYFWFDDQEICNAFERFYGAHRDTKTDLMIQIDAANNKYELSLYRYGIRHPQILHEKGYELLVFKSQFEHYRSSNYNQENGAWLW